jgi:hypothetical protein
MLELSGLEISTALGLGFVLMGTFSSSLKPCFSQLHFFFYLIN